jgi:hypothetical protein
MQFSADLPSEIESLRDPAIRALGPVKPEGEETDAVKDFIFKASRSNAGRSLPPYYLVYFLLVDLLGFENVGKSEKVAWSIPVDYLGELFLIEHRKLGVGVFAPKSDHLEESARDIVAHVRKAVKVARPYFDWLAEEAVQNSEVNVMNRSRELFNRYAFLLEASREKRQEAEERRDEVNTQKGITESGQEWESFSYPSFRLHQESMWLTISAIEAFFSWTEHVFIHLAILTGSVSSAKQVAELAQTNWQSKFKTAIDLGQIEAKNLYDDLVRLKREIRNYVAHGAFGMEGEAFQFHSPAGAVPVLLPHRSESNEFRFGHSLDFSTEAALDVLEAFPQVLWSGERAAARLYIHEAALPSILPMAQDGSYEQAMKSPEEMRELVDHLTFQFDMAANMDW